ncbi:hypothetical protein [Mycobacterium sp. 1164985.4]|uniref:hypothetical protein n=1 Tax=Mycobacterium sp. 1164985.4 TaxID=1834069 RepID=UPI0012EAF70F|nr:hypothetical protein [Mycobacterium sp. 1164985.4]
MAGVDAVVGNTALLDACTARVMIGAGAMRTRPAADGCFVGAVELSNDVCSDVTGAKYVRLHVG